MILENLITFQSETNAINAQNHIESPSILNKNSPAACKKADNTDKDIKNKNNSDINNNNKSTNNPEYFIENLENKFSLANVQDADGAYEAQQTGNFNLVNPLFAKIKAEHAENQKRISAENMRLESFRAESLFKKTCFFCARNKQNFTKNQNNLPKNENKLNIESKGFDESMTEKLKVLMKSFNIERRFSDKLDGNRDLYDTQENEDFKNSLAEVHKYDFNNYYPKNLSFILLDLRISVDKKEKFYDYKAGFLPMTVVVEQEELIDDHVTKLFFFQL